MSEAPSTAESRSELAQKLGLHPIAAEAAALAEPASDDSDRVSFAPGTYERLEEQVRALAHDPDLEHALRSLVALANYIGEDLGQEDIAVRLYEVAAVGAPALQRQKADKTSNTLDKADAASGALRKFSGEGSVERQAPMQGGSGTSGSVSLKDLLPKGPLSGR